jgi:hypothetical protein
MSSKTTPQSCHEGTSIIQDNFIRQEDPQRESGRDKTIGNSYALFGWLISKLLYKQASINGAKDIDKAEQDHHKPSSKIPSNKIMNRTNIQKRIINSLPRWHPH